MTEPPVDDWNGALGERWLANIDAFESMIAPVGEALLTKASIGPGEAVADIGCGCGPNSFDIARIVGAEGRVTGIDVSGKLLAKAEERRAAAGLSNVAFVQADAQTGIPDAAPFDRLFSRFGVMFFDDTQAAFANMRGWLKPGGHFTFSCWGPPGENPWIGFVAEIVGRHVAMPLRDPAGPGPFRLADAQATEAMLREAGYDFIEIDLWRGEQHLGGMGADPESAADFVMGALGIGEALKDSGADIIADVRRDVVEIVKPYHRAGAIRMDASAWFITVRNPA
ncbi:class I SAM-dependent methyltransferase [Parasphingopyxis marina]|uniref:Class I SAM-dependent methyltransferase n=1 Tax=Parasphingopyxis marina TaxID=2761622 RepID=A0A842I2T5_9SPHN|nr:class I SAM-dependent methyltransferase [Parasphingopyxis marina]MBC2778600.1 class I SAM-dependent methyltransferase [Parasphingopyxis marina]